MRRTCRPYLAAGVAVAGAGLIVVPPLTPPVPDVQAREIQLTSGDTADSPLGDGTAFVIGPSGIPIPSASYVDSFDQLYLAPRGFTGTAQALFNPNGLYPVTGVKSLPLDPSVAQGQQIIDDTVTGQIASGQVDAANPVVIGGYSQSSTTASLTMLQLADQGVPSDDVHFVLVGDPSNPNGGLLERFDVPAGTSPSFPSLGITLSGATPDDLYPTDIYTAEYDAFPDFPRYPLDIVSDLNAVFGVIYGHLAYLGFTPEQIADAIQLPTSAADTLTNYYIIPAETLPLLNPLRLIPVVGNPLADLLQPDLSVLVNLGYGSITHGWDPGPADVPTPFGLVPPLSVLEQVPQALASGMQQGITAAVADLQNPDNYHISLQSILDSGGLTPLLDAAKAAGFIDTTNLSQLLTIPSLLQAGKEALTFIGFPVSDATLLSSPTDILDDLTATVSADYAALLPVADTVTAFFTGLPAYDATLFSDQLQAGNLLEATADPIVADLVLVPAGIGFGAAAPIGEAAGGTLFNLVDLLLGS